MSENQKQYSEQPISPEEARFAELREQLCRGIDWKALVEDVAEERVQAHGVNTLVSTLCMPDHTDEPEGIQQNIQRLLTAWEALRPYRLPESEHQPDTTTTLVSGNLVGVIDDWTASTRMASTVFLSDARYDKLKEAAPYKDQDRLSRLALNAGLDDHNNGETPAVIAEAIEQAVSRRILEFERLDYDTIQELRQSRPNLTLITGHQALTVTTGVGDPAPWIGRELALWPDWFHSGVGQIAIEPGELNQTEDGQQVAAGVGEWVNKDNALRVSAQTEYYFEKRAEDVLDKNKDTGMSRTTIQHFMRKNTREILAHELMHNAHANVLPLRWLREWMDMAERDDVSVTPYVEKARRPDTKGKRLREDLCDSTALYATRPATLAWKSARRFMALQDLFVGYAHGEIAQLSEELHKLDPDDPDLKMKLLQLDNEFAKKFVAIHHPPVLSRP